MFVPGRGLSSDGIAEIAEASRFTTDMMITLDLAAIDIDIRYLKYF